MSRTPTPANTYTHTRTQSGETLHKSDGHHKRHIQKYMIVMLWHPEKVNKVIDLQWVSVMDGIAYYLMDCFFSLFFLLRWVVVAFWLFFFQRLFRMPLLTLYLLTPIMPTLSNMLVSVSTENLFNLARIWTCRQFDIWSVANLVVS